MTKKPIVLVVHNRYQQLGGEDSVVDDEIKMLRENGHEVHEYRRNNVDINNMSKFRLFVDTIWSRKTVKEVSELISKVSPDIVHAHNTFPLVSPSLFWVVSSARIPIIQTIHNFRLSCLQAMFLRDNKVCELCKGKIPWRGVVHKCYRNSFISSFVLACMLMFHRVLGTFTRQISAYIALNGFCKNKLIEIGINPSAIRVKPNFVRVSASVSPEKTGNPLYVGRLSQEKGISVLLDVIKKMPSQQFDIVGDGPLIHEFDGIANVNVFGELGYEAVITKISNAPYLIMPSIWYENMPRTLVEAFSCGTPVIASNIGALKCLIKDKVTGLLFEPGSHDSLYDAVMWAKNNVAQMTDMGKEAYVEFNEKYTSQKNYLALNRIYLEVIDEVNSKA
jgi:glycosyltransferase involved in cell wall biosynthesis